MQRGTIPEVFLAFLKLGLTSFGGPIAHIGYFHREFVDRRRWLSDAAFADLVAVCQILPGPASSQLGFALGLMRAGYGGALAAFVAFTLPSAVLMVLFALGLGWFSGSSGLLAGLKIVAVAVVAQAVLGMARTLTPDAPRATIAVLAVACTAALPGAPGMLLAIALGLAAGLFLPAAPQVGGDVTFPVSRRVGLACLLTFAGLLLALPLLAQGGVGWAVLDAFFRAGSFVFGGGHVVLPLLDGEVVQRGWIAAPDFLAGYSAAQAVPGPLFTFAAYLGWMLQGPVHGLAGALIALAGIFAPGFLLILGVLPFWQALRRRPRFRAALSGANAAVVGLLASALYAPVFTSAIHDLTGFTLALAGFVALTAWRMPAWAVVLASALAGALLL